MGLTVDSIRIFVADLDLAVPFYSETLGLPVLDSDTEIGYAVLDGGGVTVILERDDEAESEEESLAGVFTGVSFAVDDIFAVHKDLSAKGVRFDEPPSSQPWGGVIAHFSDPDQNVLTLVQYPEA